VATRSPTRILLFALPLLLVVAAGVLGLLARTGDGPDSGSHDGESPTRPLALPPVEAPDADGPDCARLVAALPAELSAAPGPLPRVSLADPAPPGALAWSGDRAGSPVVLRCGLPRPAELVPGAALLQVDGVAWLTLSQPDRDTFISVDRAVYVALTVPRGLGSGPLQTVSQNLRAALPAG
jgi:hypothetical protein